MPSAPLATLGLYTAAHVHHRPAPAAKPKRAAEKAAACQTYPERFVQAAQLRPFAV